MRRRQTFDVFEYGGVFGLIDTEQQEVRNGELVELDARQRMAANGVETIRKYQAVALFEIEKRLYAEMISRAEQLPPSHIPDGKSEIAQQAIDTVTAPGEVSVQNELRVRNTPACASANAP